MTETTTTFTDDSNPRIVLKLAEALELVADVSRWHTSLRDKFKAVAQENGDDETKTRLKSLQQARDPVVTAQNALANALEAALEAYKS